MGTRFDDIFLSGVISGTVSGMRDKKGGRFQIVRIRPYESKGEHLYHFSFTVGTKELHENLLPLDAAKKVDDLLREDFSQALLCTDEADWHASSIGKLKVRKKPPTKGEFKPQSHNREKNALIERTADFLIRLGVSSPQGVLKGKMDKFRQINKYLELVAGLVPKTNSVLHIIDFGCGKAYLTFALYHYLVEVVGIDCRISGLDLKEDVIEFCNRVAAELGYNKLSFHVGDISGWETDEPVDMVVSLHACDTATDAAIAKAVSWGAKTVIAVPCCQHELFGMISSDTQSPLLKHGILKERIAALVTDAARAQLLESVGYNVDVIEFIDMEHTPKNIMIRATKTSQVSHKAFADYRNFVDSWRVDPCLEALLEPHLHKK